MNLQAFKEEFRFICTDTWGDAMGAWFEAAGQLYDRGIDLPYEWEYRAGLTDKQSDKESYWYELYNECSSEELLKIGKFLFRYCGYLKYHNMDY